MGIWFGEKGMEELYEYGDSTRNIWLYQHE